MSTFAGALSARAMDPVLPQVAADLAVTIQVAATVASAFAVTFALVQPALGVVADVFGKAKLIFICLIVLGASNIAGAFSLVAVPPRGKFQRFLPDRHYATSLVPSAPTC
jgi:MFS family permease